MLNFSQYIRKTVKRDKENYRSVSILSNFSKYIKKNYTGNSIIILKIYFFQVNVALEGVIVHYIVS